MPDNKDRQNTPKAFRIYPFYYHLFEACQLIVGRDVLSDYLIKKHYNFKELPTIDSKSHLLEKMILDVRAITDNINTIRGVLNSPRMVQLREFYRYKGFKSDSPKKRLLAVRISDEVYEIIKHFSKDVDTIGEVIEIAIAFHISNAPSPYVDLITFIIDNLAEQKDN